MLQYGSPQDLNSRGRTWELQLYGYKDRACLCLSIAEHDSAS